MFLVESPAVSAFNYLANALQGQFPEPILPTVGTEIRTHFSDFHFDSDEE